MPRIRFLPSDREASVGPGVRLTEACRAAGVTLPLSCGGKGLCGACRVRFLTDPPPADDAQRRCLPDRLLRQGWRAACILAADRDMDLADPDARPEAAPLSEFTARDPDPPSGWEVRDIRPDPPTPADPRDDHSRFLAALGGDAALPLPALRHLPTLLREHGFACRALCLDGRPVRLGPPREAGVADPGLEVGLAVDLGTTTLAAALCRLDDGRVLASAGRANPQAEFGDDVISRVTHAARGQEQLRTLARLAVEAVRELAAETMAAAGLAGMPAAVTVAGNTVMNHIFLGVPPGGVAASPFAPAFTRLPPIPGEALGWPDDPAPLVHIVPNVSAFVGGDIVAGMVAHDLAGRPDTCLFLDVGTNGEMALAHGGRLFAAAAAAGPAFEGARIGAGMRAARGAIARVALAADGGLDIGVVDGPAPAAGLCGTGLLDTVAALLAAGILDAGGRLPTPEEARRAGGRAAGLASRLFRDGDETGVWLALPGGRGAAGVALTQADIREFQLAKGAVAAGVRVLLDAAGIGPERVETILLAGGFGSYLDPLAAARTGLLPAGLDPARARAVGNAALAGARLCLASAPARRAAEATAARVEYVELSGRAEFESAFAEAMLFPEQE